MPMAGSLSPSVCASEPIASACSVNAGRQSFSPVLPWVRAAWAATHAMLCCHYLLQYSWVEVHAHAGAPVLAPGRLVNEARSTFTRTRPAAWHILWEENTEDIEI